jgi:hypothetical protein
MWESQADLLFGYCRVHATGSVQTPPQMLMGRCPLRYLHFSSSPPNSLDFHFSPDFSSIYSQLVSISSPHIHPFNKYLLSTYYVQQSVFTIPQVVLQLHFSLKLLWEGPLFVIKPMVILPVFFL